MQNFRDIQEKVFQDCRNIISELNSAESKEDLLRLEDKIFDLEDLLNFLRISNDYDVADEQGLPLEFTDNQEESIEDELNPTEEIKDKYIAEEEVIFNNELNEIEDSEIHHPEVSEHVLEEEAVFNNELNEIENVENEIDAENTEESLDLRIEEEEVEAMEEVLESQTTENEPEAEENQTIEEVVNEEEYNENRGKIVEFTKEDFQAEQPQTSDKIEELNEIAEEMQQKTAAEHKFKLANIKGLKKVESLFDDDPLEHMKEEEPVIQPSGSLLKSNVPTDYMEADKPKPEFKLDLNDKIAFSKMLFGGSQVEMNETVNKLNSFANLDQAKEYLSDLYYERNWEKVDEYAQRLWSLVENKFQ